MWNMFKGNNKDSGMTPRSGVFIVNFEHISHLVLMFMLLNLNIGLSLFRILQNVNSGVFARRDKRPLVNYYTSELCVICLKF